MNRRMPGLILALLILIPLLIGARGCELTELSGITMDGEGRFVVVNNRPGAFARCSFGSDGLDCERLPWRVSTHEKLDMEGVVYAGDNLYFVAIEKTNNQCLSGCELSQQILSFSIDAKGQVTEGRCGPLVIPIMEGDDADCPFANCGLEGVAYDPDRKLLYVAKEAKRQAIYAAQLDRRGCPNGAFIKMKPPKFVNSYNDIVFSRKRQSLFVLSSVDKLFYEWHLPSDSILTESTSIPAANAFLREVSGVEGIYMDDRRDTLILLSESGEFLTLKLPMPQKQGT